MSDKSQEELISAYLDGELSAEEQARTEKLLAENAELRQLHEELRALRNALASLPRYQLKEDLSDLVCRRAEREILADEDEKNVERLAKHPVGANDSVLSRRSPRTWRAVVWPVLVIAAALMLMVTQRKEEAQRKIASAPKGPAPQAEMSAPTGSAKELEEVDKKIYSAAQPRDSDVKSLENTADQSGPRGALSSPVIAGRSKSDIAPAALVISCMLTPEAVSSGAFDKLLVRNHLAESKLAEAKVAEPTDLGLKPNAQIEIAADETSSSESFGLIAEPREVAVDLTPQQLAATLVDLQEHPEQFTSVQLSNQSRLVGKARQSSLAKKVDGLEWGIQDESNLRAPEGSSKNVPTASPTERLDEPKDEAQKQSEDNVNQSRAGGMGGGLGTTLNRGNVVANQKRGTVNDRYSNQTMRVIFQLRSSPPETKPSDER